MGLNTTFGGSVVHDLLFFMGIFSVLSLEMWKYADIVVGCDISRMIFVNL